MGTGNLCPCFILGVFGGVWSINKRFQVNGNIGDSNVLVIDSDGSNLGILDSGKALSIAESKGLDLVQVSLGNAEINVPPTCRIMDYGKYCYTQDKKNKDNRKKQKAAALKEIGLSVNIGEGDFATKVRHAQNFLRQGNKVKAVIKFRGRENNDPSRGVELMGRFASACEPLAKIESKAQVEGNRMIMILSANTQARQDKTDK